MNMLSKERVLQILAEAKAEQFAIVEGTSREVLHQEIRKRNYGSVPLRAALGNPSYLVPGMSKKVAAEVGTAGYTFWLKKDLEQDGDPFSKYEMLPNSLAQAMAAAAAANK